MGIESAHAPADWSRRQARRADQRRIQPAGGVLRRAAAAERCNARMQSPETKRRAPSRTASGIVIIEEDKLMRELLVEWLSAEGYSVRAAATGDAQVPGKADLVIVDVYMPRHEGANRL